MELKHESNNSGCTTCPLKLICCFTLSSCPLGSSDEEQPVKPSTANFSLHKEPKLVKETDNDEEFNDDERFDDNFFNELFDYLFSDDEEEEAAEDEAYEDEEDNDEEETSNFVLRPTSNFTLNKQQSVSDEADDELAEENDDERFLLTRVPQPLKLTFEKSVQSMPEIGYIDDNMFCLHSDCEEDEDVDEEDIEYESDYYNDAECCRCCNNTECDYFYNEVLPRVARKLDSLS